MVSSVKIHDFAPKVDAIFGHFYVILIAIIVIKSGFIPFILYACLIYIYKMSVYAFVIANSVKLF